MDKYISVENNKLYRVWASMKQRCYDSKSSNYKDYGGRGIRVCDRWLNDPVTFYRDMYPTYKHGLTLDRLNNDGDYEPNNVRWATSIEQANNRRTNVWLEHKGITRTIAQWSDELNIKQTTICQRIYQYDWSVDRALSTPVRSWG